MLQITIKCPCGFKVSKVPCLAGGVDSSDISDFQKYVFDVISIVNVDMFFYLCAL